MVWACVSCIVGGGSGVRRLVKHTCMMSGGGWDLVRDVGTVCLAEHTYMGDGGWRRCEGLAPHSFDVEQLESATQQDIISY